jgi:hypothetical protein
MATTTEITDPVARAMAARGCGAGWQSGNRCGQPVEQYERDTLDAAGCVDGVVRWLACPKHA